MSIVNLLQSKHSKDRKKALESVGSKKSLNKNQSYVVNKSLDFGYMNVDSADYLVLATNSFFSSKSGVRSPQDGSKMSDYNQYVKPFKMQK